MAGTKHPRLEYLFERYFQGACTPAEKTELLDLVDQAQYDDELRRLMDGVWGRLSSVYQVNDEQSERILSKILPASPGQRPPAKAVRSRLLKWSMAAAVLPGVLIVGVLWYRGHLRDASAGSRTTAQFSRKDSGSNKTVLTLGNGKTVILDSMPNGIVARQGGLPVIKLHGRLSYAFPGIKGAAAVYNTVSTPRGKQYEIVLPDSSRVWLNAMSSLRFPTAFRGNERNVTLTGEAYFEVASDKERPFRVNMNGMKVEVLGTSFNVMAYRDAPVVKTTLLTGRVKVSGGGDQVVLKPGREALLNHAPHARLKIEKADIQEAVAWKNGLFLFRNSGLHAVLREIARWYDIEVVYQGQVHARLNGMISRNTDLSQLLHMLEVTSKVSFDVRGRQVIVKPASPAKLPVK